jgi:hypothetical protein
MPGNKYNDNSNHLENRVARLVRIRELRKSKRASHSNETADNDSRLSESLEHDLRLREDENGGVAYENGEVSGVEQFFEGPGAARLLSEGCERQDEKPLRQRLLVVANRLPVSAVRRGEDSWSLEISAGGLVSALLGKWWLDSHIEYLGQLMSSIILQTYLFLHFNPCYDLTRLDSKVTVRSYFSLFYKFGHFVHKEESNAYWMVFSKA